MDEFEERTGYGATLMGGTTSVRPGHHAIIGDHVHLTPKSRTDNIDLVVKVSGRDGDTYQGEVFGFRDGPAGKDEWNGYKTGQSVSFLSRHIKTIELKGS